MSNPQTASVEKGNIKLTEYSESSVGHDGKYFLQCTCVGFYLTEKDLIDLATVVNYYLNADEITEVQVRVGGEHVAL
jgi:hypothetical protein